MYEVDIRITAVVSVLAAAAALAKAHYSLQKARTIHIGRKLAKAQEQ